MFFDDFVNASFVTDHRVAAVQGRTCDAGEEGTDLDFSYKFYLGQVLLTHLCQFAQVDKLQEENTKLSEKAKALGKQVAVKLIFQHIIGCCSDGRLEGGGEESKGGGEEEQGDEDTEGHQECGIADNVDVDSCYASWSTNAIPFAISFGGGLFCDLVCSFL